LIKGKVTTGDLSNLFDDYIEWVWFGFLKRHEISDLMPRIDEISNVFAYRGVEEERPTVQRIDNFFGVVDSDFIVVGNDDDSLAICEKVRILG
jgi:hypothetical protein